MARTPISTIAQFAPCTINVRGKVGFSRVASKIEGQELELQNKQYAAKGRPQHAKPYITITINNPTIVDNGRVPEQVKSVIKERFFTKQDGTVCFTQESKSPFMPTVVYSAEAGALSGQGIADSNVPLPGEFASGLDVTIGVDLYVMKGSFNNAGLGIKYILVNEPVKYFSRNSIASDLEAQGITYTAPTASSAQPAYQAPAAPAPVVEQYQAPVTPQYNSAPMTAPQPYSAPTPAPVAQPAYQAPAPQPTYQAPAQPAYQAPAQPAPMQPAPWDDSDIPFNAAPAQQAPGATPTMQRPVRYY